MSYTHIIVDTHSKPDGEYVAITLNRLNKRNALSLELMSELLDAFQAVGAGKARGVMLAAAGPVFSAGHDFADMAGRDLAGMRALL